VTSVNTTANYNSLSNTCTNVTCHNPDSVVVGKGLTDKTNVDTNNNPVWQDTYVPNNQVCTFCHVKTPNVAGVGGSHYEHDNLKNYACETCHFGYFSASTHNNLVLNHRPATDIVAMNGALGGESLNSGVWTMGTATCTVVYCHGDTAAMSGTGGTDPTPIWGNAATGACGTCHNGTTIATGQHTTHRAAAYGPQAACTNCHADSTSAQHVDGYKNFSDALVITTTTACDTCHAGSGSTAKAEWTQAAGHWLGVTGGYCEHCHDATASVVTTLAGTLNNPMTAPNVLGDNVTYGAAFTGHGLAAASNYASGNPGAEKTCLKCHTTTSTHINSTNGTAFADHRLVGTLNTPAVPVVTIEGVCNACHQNVGTELGTQVSRHGNSGTGAVEGAFTQGCTVCHDVHGMVYNGTGPNMSMIRGTVASPDGPRAVVFTQRTNLNSFENSSSITGTNISGRKFAKSPSISRRNLRSMSRPFRSPYSGQSSHST
jgi:predicted CxxxxCH...CXXCH cytochrome family protein